MLRRGSQLPLFLVPLKGDQEIFGILPRLINDLEWGLSGHGPAGQQQGNGSHSTQPTCSVQPRQQSGFPVSNPFSWASFLGGKRAELRRRGEVDADQVRTAGMGLPEHRFDAGDGLRGDH